MCGSPVEGRPYRVVVEGVELVLCRRCHVERLRRTRTTPDDPMRYRLALRSTTPQARIQTTPSRKPATEKAKPLQPIRSLTMRPKPRGVSLREAERFEVVDDYSSRVRRARERLGYTQRDLARKAKIAESVIRRIELGELVPSIDLARKLEKVLGIKLLEPVVETEEELSKSKRENLYLTLGDIAEFREE